MSLELVINLVASFLAFLIGWMARTLLSYYRSTRPVARLWQVNRHAPVTAVVGDHGEGRLLWEADALAAMNVRLSLARELKIHSIKTVRASAFSMAAHAEDNVVVIGGPAMNQVWNIYADRLDIPYEFKKVDDLYRIVAREGDESFGGTRGREGGVKQDSGLVIFAWNPFEPGNRLIMMAGCGELATLAAPSTFSPEYARKIAQRFDMSKPLALVLSVEDVNDYVAKPKIAAWAYFPQPTVD
ncbi:hypothetical protein [Streptomyces sp. NPDC096142]|uniref:hypothetical protein n=1 Tax=Streptomyces sp. NPDC096142 TaxID=3366077 RepID=UPI003822A9C6